MSAREIGQTEAFGIKLTDMEVLAEIIVVHVDQSKAVLTDTVTGQSRHSDKRHAMASALDKATRETIKAIEKSIRSE